MSTSRRHFLKTTPALLGLSGCGKNITPAGKKIRVAAILTTFFYRSHAHVILENFLEPYLFNGKVVDPTQEFEIVSFHVDQFGTSTKPDMARTVAKQFGIPVFPSIHDALTRDEDDLSVDAVLVVGEHGEYPFNEKGQELYPKKRFFDEIVAVFQKSGRSVPVYNDKHLSHIWSEAKEMVDTAKRMGFGLMAASSVPLAQRIPPLELEGKPRITRAVSIHGGPLERYGFHGLEVLQSMVESRQGGETGISEVQYFEGDALWKAADEGRWSEDLATAAMAAELGGRIPPLREMLKLPEFSETPPHGFLLNYRDGLSAIVLKIGQSDIRWNFAADIEGTESPVATRFYGGPWNNRNLFKALAHAIQDHFRNNRPPWPIERTLLTSGALEAAIDSKVAGEKAVKTPYLDVVYQAVDYRAMREMGKTWEIINEETKQPEGIEPVMIGR